MTKNRTFLAVSLILLIGALAVGIFKNQLFFRFASLVKPAQAACVPLSMYETGEFLSNEKVAIFNNHEVNYLAHPLAQAENSSILGETTEEKWIDIDLSDQTITAMQGDTPVMQFPISSGKWAPTPQGEFRIWIKLRYSTMSGGNKNDGTYYYLPNVPYVMFFYGPYGIHGAYWHNNFGTPMSHGCVNMSVGDSQALFDWALPVMPQGESIVKPTQDNPGSRVVVHE